MHYLASDGALKDIDTNLRLDVSSPNRLDKSGAYYIIDSGLYNVAFAAASGQGAYDVAYEVPRPVQPKFYDPGKPPAPITRIRWKILSYGYFDRQRSTYQILQNASLTTPVVSGNTIDYPQIFNNIAVRYTCGNASLKEEIVLSQTARNTLPDPAKFNLSRANTYFVVAMEFLLTPNNINGFTRRQGNKTPIKQGDNFSFDGDDPIDFEDEHTTLQFFFPRDYAHAVGDSVTGFSNRIGLRRYFYSQAGKNYLLVGVPYNWITGSPAGDLIIDPTTSVGVSDDVWLEDASNYDGHSAGLLMGKAGCCPKKRTIIKFNIAGSGIPSAATVLNAQMKLYYYTADNGGSGAWVDRWVQAHQLLVNWAEAQATSINRLTATPWNVSYVGLNDIDAKSAYESTLLCQQNYPRWQSWDLTGLTQKWVNLTAANYGVVLWATNETTGGYDLRFYSSEYTVDTSLRPKLEIIWSQLPRTVYFLKDHLGSIRASVQDTSTAPVVGYDDYDPWGYILAGRSSITSGWGSQAGIMKNKFTGKEWDDEFGLNWNYFGARYYDPQIGRWMVRDALAGKYPNLSPYVYGANNPLRFVDPDGRKLKDIPKQLGVLYAGLGATSAVIIADDITGVGVIDDPLLVPVAGVAVAGTVGIIGANVIDELINVFEQRNPKSQFPKKPDPKSAEQDKGKLSRARKFDDAAPIPAPPQHDKPPDEDDLTKKPSDKKPTTKEKVKEATVKFLELLDSLFGGGASGVAPPVVPPSPPPKEEDKQNEY